MFEYLESLIPAGGVGLSLDGDTVCVVEAKGEKLTAIERRIEAAEDASRPKAAAEAVRAAVKAAGAEKKRLHASLTLRDSVIRCFTMPWLPRNERKNAVRFQAQKYMPFDLESMCYDFEIFEDKKANRLTVVFMASRKETVNTFVTTLANAGVSVETLEPASLSLARASFHQTAAKPEEVHAILAVGDTSLSVAMVKNKMLLSSQDVRVGQSALSGSPAEAVTELLHAFDFFSKSFKGEEVRRILVVASAGQDAEKWKTALAAEFAGAVELLRPPKPLAGAAFTPCSAAALGLSIKRTGIGAPRINLLSKDTATLEKLKQVETPVEKKQLRRWVAAELGIVGGLTALILVALLFFIGMESNAVAELTRTRPSVMSVSPEASLESVRAQEIELGQKMRSLRAMIDDRPFMTTKWGEIARLSPVSLTVHSIEFRDYTGNGGVVRRYLAIDGMVYSTESSAQVFTINSFLAALKASPTFMSGLIGGKITQVSRVETGGLGMKFQLEFSDRGSVENNPTF